MFNTRGPLLFMNKKELAKFLSGVSAWETAAHTALGMNGLIPITLFGFTITPTINTMLIIFPAIITIFLVYYAWFKK